MAHPTADLVTPNYSERCSKSVVSNITSRKLFALPDPSSIHIEDTPTKGLDLHLPRTQAWLAFVQRYRFNRLLILSVIGCFLFVLSQLLVLRDYERTALRINFENERIQGSFSKKRRIVLLAGPHKTGTTSIQSNLFHWSMDAHKIDRNHDTIVLPTWYWPVPIAVENIEKNDPNNFNWTSAKGFYALIEAMRNHSLYRVENRMLFQNYTYDQVVNMYRVELQRSWKLGYNIVLGSEALDYCIKDVDGLRLLQDFLDLLPGRDPGSSDELSSKYIDHVTAVVTYRSPRVDHLVSIWHQTKRKAENFRDWMLKNKNELGALDSLALTEMFLNVGLHVVLIDSSGVMKNGYDISSVVACDILGADCTTDKTLVQLQSEPLVKNVKAHKNFNLNADKSELEAMDQIMIEYDCNFKKLAQHPNLTILYANDLTLNLELCTDADNIISRREMKQQLVDIIKATDRNRLKYEN